MGEGGGRERGRRRERVGEGEGGGGKEREEEEEEEADEATPPPPPPKRRSLINGWSDVLTRFVSLHHFQLTNTGHVCQPRLDLSQRGNLDIEKSHEDITIL